MDLGRSLCRQRMGIRRFMSRGIRPLVKFIIKEKSYVSEIIVLLKCLEYRLR